MDGVAHLGREAPLHALMAGVMAATMLTHSSMASIAGAALLVVVSVPCAALSRRWSFLHEHVVDLWAMALLLLVLLPRGSSPGQHHLVTVDAGWAAALVVGGWLGIRAWLLARSRARRSAALSAGVTAAGLLVMVLLCG